MTINGGTLKDTSYDPDATDNMNPWITRGIDTEKVTTISIENNITAGKSISGLFANFSNVQQFTGLDKIDTSNTVDMSYLFSKSSNFGEQDLNHWKVSNVENFSSMFSRNEKLKKLDISNWNWANGNNFTNMFNDNTNLVSLILPKNINSTSVSDRSRIMFRNMFDGESALTSLDISNLDMSGLSYENIEDTLINNDNLQEVTLSPQNFLAKSYLYIYRDGNMSGGTIPVAWIAVESDDPKVAVGTIKDVDKLKNMYNGLSGDHSKTTWKWDYELPMRFKARYVAEDDHSKIFYTDDEYTNQPPYTYFKTDFDASKVPSNISLDDYYTGYKGEVFLTKNDKGVALIPVPKKQYTVQVIETNTAGTENKVHTFYVPIGKSDGAETDFSEEIKDFPEDREMIDYFDGATSFSDFSYFEMDPYGPDDSEVYLFGELWDQIAEHYSIPVSELKSKPGKIVEYFLESASVEREIHSGYKTILHIVYEPEENSTTGNNTNSGSHSSSNEVKPENNEPESINGTLGTYNDSPEVKLYDDSGTELTDRKLAPSSDWFTDETRTLNGDKYYRVATNQWAKADDVYIYHGHAANVLVNSDSIASLVTASGKPVTDRALQANSGWYTDRYIYINNDKYYRVATNEFVSADKVQEY
ncbi:BspA family leucine-rich repeat surface protein [Companilactobacillus muriivasis]|uniref:BspA family leucine-rich repeat surface protein n=1 Tax=Companilactobacillus muriivasis TaxID=3081444 RepID=UPI0030C6B60D